MFSTLFLSFLFFTSFGNTYMVTNGNDAGTGSLRQAVADAIANPGNDDIDVSSSVFVITLDTTLPPVFSNNLPTLSDMTINGNNAVVISSIPSMFAFLGDNVVLNNLRFSGFAYGCLRVVPSDNAITEINNCDFTNCNNTGSFPYAGAIWHIEGQLILSSCNFTNCSAISAGAIVSGGAGIFLSDKLSMDNCSFSNNTSINNGGLGNAVTLNGSLIVELSGVMSFDPSPVQDIRATLSGDDPFTGSITLLPTFQIALGDVFSITN